MIRIDIQNDRTGDDEVASYDVTMWIPEGGRFEPRRARVQDFDRSRGWAELAREAVAVLEANDGDELECEHRRIERTFA